MGKAPRQKLSCTESEQTVPVIGSLPRHHRSGFAKVSLNPWVILLSIKDGVKFAVTGKPSRLVLDAGASNWLGLALLPDSLLASSGYRRQLLRLAAEDAFAVHKSIRLAFVVAELAALLGTSFLGAGMVAYLLRIREFAWSQLAILVGFGLVHSVFILRGLTRDVGPRAPALRVMLLLWCLGASPLVFSLGYRDVLRAWMLRPLSVAEQAGYGALIYALVALATLVISTVVWQVRVRMTCSIFFKQYALSTAVFELLYAAYLLKRSGDMFLPLAWQWNAVNSLNNASKSISHGVSKLVHVRDLPTRVAIQRRMDIASHGMNGISRSILLGGTKMREVALADILRCAEAILTQQYDLLPDVDAGEVAERQRELQKAIRIRIFHVARQGVISLLPLALLALISRLPMHLPQETMSALSTLAGVWLVIKALSVIDPNYRSTLDDAKVTMIEMTNSKKFPKM